MVRKMLLSWMLRDCSEWDSHPWRRLWAVVTGRPREHTAAQLEVPMSLRAGLLVPRRADHAHTVPSPPPKSPTINSMPDAQTQQIWLFTQPQGWGVSSHGSPSMNLDAELWCAWPCAHMQHRRCLALKVGVCCPLLCQLLDINGRIACICLNWEAEG